MAKILICYYSKTGNTKKMAEFVAEGAKDGGAVVTLNPIDEVKTDDLLQYDAIILGSPTYYGTLAAPVKKLLDDSVRHHGKLNGKVGGAFTSSANIAGGNETTLMSILMAWLIHGMVVQGDPKGDHYGPVAIGRPDERAASECRRYGKRIAELALRFGE